MKLMVKYDTDTIAQKAQLKVAKAGDCGYDLYNASEASIIVYPHKSVLVNSGLSVKIPDGFCAFIKGRSSTFHKRGLFVVEGVIDSGYTGPLFSHVWNPCLNGNNQPQIIAPWERLSQLVILPTPEIIHYLGTVGGAIKPMIVERVNNLPETERGNTGFGSTGL